MQVKKAVLQWLVCFCALIWGITAHAQDRKTITGIVKDSSGASLSGVTITVKGGKLLGTTDETGHFSVEVLPSQQVIVFNLVGYSPQEVSVSDSNELNVILIPSVSDGNAVVVTALGIRRSERSLTYATQQVSNSELTKVKSDNLMNSLNGKVAGVTIAPSGSGIGGSVKVILRGNKSTSASNQPLYVIDGVPMTNSGNANGQPGQLSFSAALGTGSSIFGGSTSTDGGDGISNLNPDDIESMSILEGASAAALYGSQAANGVIIITTKKGKAGKASINYSSSATLSNTAYRPKFQDNYGPATSTAQDSWGSKISSAPDNLDLFYHTGSNFTNSLNLSAGNEMAQTYFSVANTTGNGITPNNTLRRNNINFQETGHFLNNKLTVSANANYIAQRINNSPNFGFYFNPLTGLYLAPRGLDLTPYKNQYEVASPLRNGLMVQNGPLLSGPPTADNDNYWYNVDLLQNPWWIINRNPTVSKRNRLLMNASVKYDANDWFNIQARGSLDRITDYYEQDLYAGTSTVLSMGNNGQFVASNQTLQQLYGDVIANFKLLTKSAFKLDGLIGTSIMDSKREGYKVDRGLGLSIPNQFVVQNIVVSSGSTANSNVSTLSNQHSQLQAAFASANLSYDDWLYLNATIRKDWSSNLAFTDTKSYSYPSVGLSALLNKILKMPSGVNYSKVRLSYAEVGNTVPPYVTNPQNYNTSGGGISFNILQPFSTLKPERTKYWEAGTEWRFVDNRLKFNLTLYKTNTYNQFLQVKSTNPLYTYAFVNAGNIQNKGIEVILGYDAVRGDKFSWTTSVNFASNKNTIKDVDSKDGIDQFFLSNDNGLGSAITKGGSYGDIYANVISKDDQGRIIVDSAGKPSTVAGLQYAGNPNPKWQMGWKNDFTFGKVELSFLIDGKFGGHVNSITQAIMDQYGVSKESGAARDAGGVKIDGVYATGTTVNGVNVGGQAVSSVDPYNWYTTIGGRAGITGQYMYSATVVRVRELSLGYNFTFKNSFAKSMRLSVTGRNLLYISKKAPYDPEIAASTGNAFSGIDVFGMPATRNIGLNLNVTF